MSGVAIDGAGEAGGDVVPLALLAGYKVRWDRNTVARDVVQNFFDAAADFGDVRIDTKTPGRVRVEGPATFDMEYLRYLGATSKRDTRAAGGFGEGFKICALVLLRDYGVGLRAGSGPWEIRPFFRPMKLGRELCYGVVRHPPSLAPSGSWVELTGADPELCAAFDASRDWFRHPANARLSKPIYEAEDSGVGVYVAADALAGDVFYRRQIRGSVPFSKGAGLTFAFDDRIPGVEADRDRRGLRAPQRVIAAVVAKLPDEALEAIAKQLRPYWQTGHQVLTAVIAEGARRGARFTFPPRWLARVDGDYRVEDQAERRGFVLGLPSFARVGMPTAAERFGVMDVPRPPTLREEARIAVVADLYEKLLKEAPPKRRTHVREIPKGHVFYGRTGSVLDLQAATLAGSFDDGVGDVLGALARHGSQPQREDAARLTKILAAVLDGGGHMGELGAFRARWDAAAALPETEIDDDGAGHRAYGFDVPRVKVEILAPPGFPPAEEIERRLLRVTRRVRVQLEVKHVAVTSLDGAVRERARGVPSIWIAGEEVAAVRGPARYELRTYAGEAGAPSLTGPSDGELLAPIEAALGKPRRRTDGSSKRALAGAKDHERWLASNRPREALALAERRLMQEATWSAIDEISSGEEPSHETSAYGFAIAAMERAAPNGPRGAGEEARARITAIAKRAVLAYDRMMRAVRQELARLAHVHDRIWVLWMVDRYAVTLAGETRPEEAASLAVPFAVPLAELMGHLAATAALDDGCLNYARGFLGERFLAKAHLGPEAALAAGRAQIPFVARVSRRLHRAADPESLVSICAGMAPILDAKARKRKPMPADHVATRVKAAWETAIAAGKPELEAAQACLYAAEEAQAEVIADQERERKRLEAARRRLYGGLKDARTLRSLPFPPHVQIKTRSR